MEDIPDHHEASFSREGVTGGLGVLRILRPGRNLSKGGRPATLQHTRRRVRREGERGDRDRDVRGSIASAPWEENAHARLSSP